MSIFKNKYIRLAGRAALSGLLAGGAVVYASNGNVDKTVLLAAAAAAVHAFGEVFTPLNPVVGAFKKDSASQIVEQIAALLGQKDAVDAAVEKVKDYLKVSAPAASAPVADVATQGPGSDLTPGRA